jgi:hypothetical protein
VDEKPMFSSGWAGSRAKMPLPGETHLRAASFTISENLQSRSFFFAH